MAKAGELREQTIEELEALQGDLRKELYEMKGEAKQSQKFEKAHRLPQIRKDIARVLTVLREKQMASSEDKQMASSENKR